MLTSVSINLLHQLRDLLTQLSPTDYARPLAVFNGSSIGGHTRHIIEFYACLLAGLSTGVVNYDERQRDQQIEHNRDYALETIRHLERRLAQSEMPADNAILKVKFGAHTTRIDTNFQREMAYLIEHSIHHFALLRIGVAAVNPQVYIDPHFGMAFSTLNHRQTTNS
jgi:uncharacterized damage-inducible protein DinB